MPVFMVTKSTESNDFMVGSPHHRTVGVLIMARTAMQHFDLSEL